MEADFERDEDPERVSDLEMVNEEVAEEVSVFVAEREEERV